MLRGLTTVSFFADDVTAAKDWYTKLLVIEPYFVRPAEGRPRMSNSASATTSTSLASSTAGSPRTAARAQPGARWSTGTWTISAPAWSG
jgi:hypothetical protein